MQQALNVPTMTQYVVPQTDGPMYIHSKKNSPKGVAKLGKQFRGLKRYVKNRVINPVVRKVGGVPRSASVSRTLKAKS